MQLDIMLFCFKTRFIFIMTQIYKYWDGELTECYGNILSGNVYRQRHKKVKSLSTYIYYPLKTTLWGDKRDKEYTHIYRRGGISGGYSKSSFLEKEERIQEIFKEVSSFIVLNTDGENQERCCLIDEEILVELEKKFGECAYYADDFLEMKEVYSIYVNPFLMRKVQARN